MKLAALLVAFAELFTRLLDAAKQRRSERKRDELEQEVEEIRKDPVAHARNKYGGVRDTDTEAPDLHGDSADRTGDKQE